MPSPYEPKNDSDIGGINKDVIINHAISGNSMIITKFFKDDGEQMSAWRHVMWIVLFMIKTVIDACLSLLCNIIVKIK